MSRDVIFMDILADLSGHSLYQINCKRFRIYSNACEGAALISSGGICGRNGLPWLGNECLFNPHESIGWNICTFHYADISSACILIGLCVWMGIKKSIHMAANADPFLERLCVNFVYLVMTGRKQLLCN